MKALLESLRPGDRDWEIARAIDPDRLPAHIAIIMDGNGRWAARRRLPRVAGHKAGVGPVRSTVETCARLGLRVLTLYAFSVENWKRPRAEVETLWRLLRFYLRKELPELQKNDIRLQAIGRLEALPPDVRRELDSVVDATASNRGLLVNLAINYGGRTEIVDAVNSIIELARMEDRLSSLRVDEELITAHLYTSSSPAPDLLIRTSGEMRLSNFLLWQIAYAELYVTETLWPDFSRTHLLTAVLEYQKRDRRYGGLSAVRLADTRAADSEEMIAALPHQMKRVLTALVLFPIITWVVLWSPIWTVYLVTSLVALLCFYEYSGIAAAYQAGPFGPLGYGAGLLMLVLPGDRPVLVVVVAVALMALSLALRADDLRAGVVRSAFLVMGVVYVFGCWRFAPLLAGQNRYWLLYALVLNWIGDIGAYYVGRALGRHKLAPVVSPGKSWEGAAASLAASMIFGFFFLRWAVPGVPAFAALALTAAANVAGQFGDLCESALKRSAGVKDSGTLLPGHGGWLDRVDSSLFALPVVYWYVSFLASR